MKRIALFFLTAAAAALLTGCGTPPAGAVGYGMYYGNAADRSRNVQDSTDNTVGRTIVANKSGAAEGHIGDSMRTCFFDFTVNHYETYSQYENYLPSDGNMLLAVDITVTNTMDEDIPMYDDDFQIQWNDPADDAYRVPVTSPWYENPPVFTGENALPAEYSLAPGESRTGLLIFEVPKDSSDFNLSYLEIYSYDDNEEELYGDVFFVYFHDRESCSQKHFGFIMNDSLTQPELPNMEWYMEDQGEENESAGEGNALYNAAGRMISADTDGVAEGHIGDTMLTYFFDFTVKSLELYSQSENLVPQEGETPYLPEEGCMPYLTEEGYQLAVIEIEIKNTFGEAIPMFDTDFAVHWNGNADNLQYPITFYMEPSAFAGDNVLPYDYILAPDECRTGLLIFKIPYGSNNLSINYLEEFDDDTIGDFFSVYLHDGDTCTEEHSGYIIRGSQNSMDGQNRL